MIQVFPCAHKSQSHYKILLQSLQPPEDEEENVDKITGVSAVSVESEFEKVTQHEEAAQDGDLTEADLLAELEAEDIQIEARDILQAAEREDAEEFMEQLEAQVVRKRELE